MNSHEHKCTDKIIASQPSDLTHNCFTYNCSLSIGLTYNIKYYSIGLDDDDLKVGWLPDGQDVHSTW